MIMKSGKQQSKVIKEFAIDEIVYFEYVNRKIRIVSSKGDFYSLPLAGVDAEREVIRRLRDFQLESKTLIECVSFIAELRQLLNNKLLKGSEMLKER